MESLREQGIDATKAVCKLANIVETAAKTVGDKEAERCIWAVVQAYRAGVEIASDAVEDAATEAMEEARKAMRDARRSAL